MSAAPSEAPRGPVHVTAEVLATRKAGAYRVLTLAAPGIPERFRPGTFVAVSTGEGRLARRALSGFHRCGNGFNHDTSPVVVLSTYSTKLWPRLIAST